MTDILFVLPVSGGSGGAHSVMQEGEAMRRLGIDVAIAVNSDNAGRLARAYRDLPAISANLCHYERSDGLGVLIRERKPAVVVATTNQSVHTIAAALRQESLSDQRTAYYIQDYEPLFYPRQSDDWITAFSSYGLIPGMIHFSKTAWLQEVVRNNHRVDVHKVDASIDHTVYFPDMRRVLAGAEPLRVTAMIRPSTPRRAPRRTVRILNRLAHEYRSTLTCSTFGCSADDLLAHSLKLSDVEQFGVLTRAEVGELFRQSDIFLDLSDYQAFGRSALEAMGCGAIPLVPLHGGGGDFAIDGFNALVVDTRSDDQILQAITALLGMTAAERRDVRLNGIATAYRYSPEQAALSELRLLLAI